MGALPNASVGLLYYKDRAVVHPPCKWPQEMAFAMQGPPGDGVDWGGHAHGGEVMPQKSPAPSHRRGAPRERKYLIPRRSRSRGHWHSHCVLHLGDAWYEPRLLGVATMTSEGMFSRILVPTDFSGGSERAWAVAQRMAANLGAELVLLHVLPGTPLDVEVLLASEERKAELRSAQAEHQLGIPRADDEDPPPARRVFEGPFTRGALREFSPQGRAWAEMLEAWAVRARDAGAKVRTVLRVGVPYREVLSEAKESHVDLVLLATHGRGEIHRLLVGSVADRVIRMAPCPVFTLKEA